MAIVLDGRSLTIEDVVKVARQQEKVEVSPEAWDRIKKCRAFLQQNIDSRTVMYGVNTGIGELAEVALTDEQVKQFQKYLVYSHAAGYGEPIAEDNVRAAILSRINVHCHGKSGMRPVVTETMVEMLNKGVTPVMCQRGSVAACGDLSPMAQMAMVLIGEGEAFYQGERLPAAEAMKRAGVPIIEFKERDGLASINGSNVITGMGSLMLHEVNRWLKTHDIAAAMTMEALNVNMKCLDHRLHEVRGYTGAIAAAANILRITADSEVLAKGRKKVQDAYSLRSTPQAVSYTHLTLPTIYSV